MIGVNRERYLHKYYDVKGNSHVHEV